MHHKLDVAHVNDQTCGSEHGFPPWRRNPAPCPAPQQSVSPPPEGGGIHGGNQIHPPITVGWWAGGSLPELSGACLHAPVGIEIAEPARVAGSHWAIQEWF